MSTEPSFAPLKSRTKPASPPKAAGPFQPRTQPFSPGETLFTPGGSFKPPGDKPASGFRTHIVRASGVGIIVLLVLLGFWAVKGRKANSDADGHADAPVVTEMLAGEGVSTDQNAQAPPARTMAEVVASVSPAVVLVEGAEQGTGIVIDRNGLVITNAHVIGEASEVYVSLNKGAGFEAVTASVVGTAPCSDLTLLRLPDGRYPALALPADTALQQLSPVFALGYPFHQHRQTATPFKSDGEIVVTEISVFGIPHMIEHTATLNNGNSGGPLFTQDGTLIGINTIGLSQTGGIYYAIDAAYARTVVEHLRDGVPLETFRLASHESIEISVNSREAKTCFTFSADQSQTVIVSVISITKHNDPTVQVYDPSNLPIPLGAAKSWDENLILTVDKTGTYLVVVGSGYNMADNYRITLTVEQSGLAGS